MPRVSVETFIQQLADPEIAVFSNDGIDVEIDQGFLNRVQVMLNKLRDKTKLRFLELSDFGLSPADAVTLLRTIFSNNANLESFTHLSAYMNGVLAELSAVLATNRSLKHLTVDQIRSPDSETFAQVVGTHPTITSLHLSMNGHPAPRFASQLFNHLKSNRVLSTFSLRSAVVNENDLVSLSEILADNSTALREISLLYCELPYRYGNLDVLIPGLRQNTTLHKLELIGGHAHFTSEQVASLIEALRYNSTLQHFELSDFVWEKCFEPAQREEINQYLQRNQAIFNLELRIKTSLAEVSTPFDMNPELVQVYLSELNELTVKISSNLYDYYSLLRVVHYGPELLCSTDSESRVGCAQLLVYTARNNQESIEFKLGLLRLKKIDGADVMLDEMTLKGKALTHYCAGADHIINYEQILTLGQQALGRLNEQAIEERELLQALLLQPHYCALSVGFFWRSPMFQTVLHQHYADPDIQTFCVLEDYLLHPTTARKLEKCPTIDAMIVPRSRAFLGAKAAEQHSETAEKDFAVVYKQIETAVLTRLGAFEHNVSSCTP